MSKQLIQQYRAQVDKLIRYGGSRNESVLRKAFQELLDHYARSKNLELVPEVEFITRKGHKVYPDGTLKDALRQNWGFWESKDEKDVLKDEIAAKFAKGYPAFNILFEDTHTAVLYQNGEEVMSASFDNDGALDELLTLFVGYEPLEVREFHKAIEQFSADVPELANTLREIIDEQYAQNEAFNKSLNDFLELCRKAINPRVEMADVREMVIQHILTEDIFMRVFDEAEFHRENAIAKNLQEVAGTFYKGATKRGIDARIAPYYETINARAAQISDHHEKQKFLKALYENFYKAYNPKAADRLGVIYTPEEIVRFMVESTDSLLYQHFGKTLGDPYVEILDPATGTGTFITELIEYLPPNQLAAKYENEIHCNEVAILPYYIANLNIEFTYKQKTGQYKEFENICFVDTLDNMGFTRSDTHQMDFFGLWDENAERIGRQNTRKISVVIGNPPYNANQLNENENNKNREYPEIDKRIKDTYIKNSTAQKTKLYDMYIRFWRWASDRINDNGIVSFVTNRSFINKKHTDGFRKVVANEFDYIYIVDLGGDVRDNTKLSGTTHNVFGIQTGVSICFMIRKSLRRQSPCQIYYMRRPEEEIAKDKLVFLNTTKINEIQFNLIHPDKEGNWLDITNNDWNELLPLASKQSRGSKTLFEDYFLGVSTNRDEWVYDKTKENLVYKMNYLTSVFNSQSQKKSIEGRLNKNDLDYSIKWSSNLLKILQRKETILVNNDLIVISNYRPFSKGFYYSDKLLSDRLTSSHYTYFGKKLNNENLIIATMGLATEKPFATLATNLLPDLNFLSPAANGCRLFAFYKYLYNGEPVENITDWGLEKFKRKYKDKKISKLDLFYYIYAVLHNPNYRNKYFQNLKRDFPRIPFYKDFWQWVEWGKRLLELHLNFEQVEPYPLTREDKDGEKLRRAIAPRLLARKEQGVIEIDTLTTLRGVPPEAWQYRLGTYTALEWVLERYKEKEPRDPTIREKFNTYKFADYKEQVIDLLMRVCTVSVETMKIIAQMPEDA